MAEEKKSYIALRSLRMPQLKPSDYSLFKDMREFFGYDMRQLVVLGLRWIYAGYHEPGMREMIMTLAQQIQHEDLTVQQEIITYTQLKKLSGH